MKLLRKYMQYPFNRATTPILLAGVLIVPCFQHLTAMQSDIRMANNKDAQVFKVDNPQKIKKPKSKVAVENTRNNKVIEIGGGAVVLAGIATLSVLAIQNRKSAPSETDAKTKISSTDDPCYTDLTPSVDCCIGLSYLYTYETQADATTKKNKIQSGVIVELRIGMTSNSFTVIDKTVAHGSWINNCLQPPTPFYKQGYSLQAVDSLWQDFQTSKDHALKVMTSLAAKVQSIKDTEICNASICEWLTAAVRFLQYYVKTMPDKETSKQNAVKFTLAALTYVTPEPDCN